MKRIAVGLIVVCIAVWFYKPNPQPTTQPAESGACEEYESGHSNVSLVPGWSKTSVEIPMGPTGVLTRKNQIGHDVSVTCNMVTFQDGHDYIIVWTGNATPVHAAGCRVCKAAASQPATGEQVEYQK